MAKQTIKQQIYQQIANQQVQQALAQKQQEDFANFQAAYNDYVKNQEGLQAFQAQYDAWRAENNIQPQPTQQTQPVQKASVSPTVDYINRPGDQYDKRKAAATIAKIEAERKARREARENNELIPSLKKSEKMEDYLKTQQEENMLASTSESKKKRSKVGQRPEAVDFSAPVAAKLNDPARVNTTKNADSKEKKAAKELEDYFKTQQQENMLASEKITDRGTDKWDRAISGTLNALNSDEWKELNKVVKAENKARYDASINPTLNMLGSDEFQDLAKQGKANRHAEEVAAKKKYEDELLESQIANFDQYNTDTLPTLTDEQKAREEEILNSDKYEDKIPLAFLKEYQEITPQKTGEWKDRFLTKDQKEAVIRTTTPEKIQYWLDPNTKLTNREIGEARAYAESELEKINYNGNHQPLVKTDEERQHYADMVSIMNKTNAISNAMAGFIKIPYNLGDMVGNAAMSTADQLGGLSAALTDKFGITEGATQRHNEEAEASRKALQRSEESMKRMMANAQTQSPLAYAGGQFAGQVTMYAVTNPVFDSIAEGVGISNALAKFFINQGAQNVQDLVLDTAPLVKELMEDGSLSEADKRELFNNILINAVGNLGMGAVQNLPQLIKWKDTKVAENALKNAEIKAKAFQDSAALAKAAEGGPIFKDVYSASELKTMANTMPPNNADDLAQSVKPIQPDNVNTAPQIVNAGKATYVKDFYTGNKPNKISEAIPVSVDDTAYANAVKTFDEAKSTQNGFRAKVREYVKGIFDNKYKNKPASRVVLNNVDFDGNDYVVEINYAPIKESLSKGHLSPEKIATFENLDEILANSEYVDSGTSRFHNTKNKDNIIRYDYFETPLTINGKNYIATIDVEVTKDSNSYKLHKVVNEINLVPVEEQGLKMPETAAPKSGLTAGVGGSPDLITGHPTQAVEGIPSNSNITDDIANVNKNSVNTLEGLSKPRPGGEMPMDPSVKAEANRLIEASEAESNKVMAEDIGLNGTDDSFEYIDPETGNVILEVPPQNKGAYVKDGQSRVLTNSAINSDIITKEELENDPVLQDIANYARHNNDTTFAQAYDSIELNGEQWKNDYISGAKTIDSDVDVDRTMLLLQRLRAKMDASKDPEKIALFANERNALLRKLREYGTKAGEGIQAFAKWNNTADGAMFCAEKLLEDETVKPWISQNQKTVDGNSRIAKALSDMGNKWKNSTEKVPLSHEEIKKGVLAEIEREYGSIENIFNDDDIEFLTNLAEDKSIPIWQITDEIEHKLNHGTWYEITKEAKEQFEGNKKLANILAKMGDDTKAVEKAAPTHEQIVNGVRNELSREFGDIEGQFNDSDIEFISQMIEDKNVKDWQIADEISHKLSTGEWYTLDESLPVDAPTNTKLKNALNSLLGEEKVKVEPETPSLSQIREEVRNTLGLEAADLEGMFTDEDIDYLANLINNNATKEELADALNYKLATGNFGISAQTQKRVNELFNEASRFDPNSKEFVDRQIEAFRLLAEEVAPKATALEKYDTWRYLAMLGNPKTMLRNFFGNGLFNIITSFSNSLSGLGEAAVDRGVKAGKKASNKLFKTNFDTSKGIQRTKSVLNALSADDRGLVNAAIHDGSRYRQMIGGKYEKMDKDFLRQQRSVFNSKLLKLYEKATDAGISDYLAVKTKYSTSLAGYLKANGFDESIFDAETKLARLRNLSETRLLTDAEKRTAEQLTKDVSALNKARDFALKQAEYATFHEKNAVADLLTKWSKEARNSDNLLLNALGYSIEGTIPFKKTPANILRSGYEYSPLGAIDSIVKTGKLIYENTGKRAGNLGETYLKKTLKGGTKEVTKTLAADVIDSWSKNLTGSGMALMGYYLAKNGILTLSDEDTKYQDQLEGIQNYAIKINGKTYTLDWAVPAFMPMAVGAEIAKLQQQSGKTDEEVYKSFSDYLSAADRVFEPMIETSMLSGVKDTLETAANDAKYSGVGSLLTTLPANMLAGYATQAIPTISGQIARTVDPIRRSTYSSQDDPVLMNLERQGRKIMNKIPGVSMLNQPYIDTYGNQQQNSPYNNPLGNLAYQMLSPSYVQKITTTPADEISRNAYDVSKNTNALPQWKSYFKDADGHRVSAEDYTKASTAYGKANYEIRDALANDEWFKGLDSGEQEEIVKGINTIAEHVGNASIDPEYSKDSDAFNAYKDGGIPSLLDYYKQQNAKNYAKDTGLSSSSNASKAIQQDVLNGDYEAADQKKEAATIIQNSGLDKPGPTATYYNAIEQYPSLTPEAFVSTYKAIDKDHNQSLKKKDEVLPYMNSKKMSYSEGMKFWKAYANKNWKIPSLVDGVWK